VIRSAIVALDPARDSDLPGAFADGVALNVMPSSKSL
jgi:hypothetical protein